MPATAKWHNIEQGILHMVVEGEWLVEEWVDAAQTISDLVTESGKPACVILEYRITQDYRAPNLLMNLHKVMSSPLAKNPLILQVLIFGERGFQKNVRNIFLRIYKISKSHYVDTWDEALKEARSCLTKSNSQ